jgi:hypothetical protein
MLHFLVDKLNVVYIGVYDWGEVECLKNMTPSLYGFAKEQDATNTKKKKKKVLVGCPKKKICLQQIKNCKFPSTNGQATRHNFEVKNIFDGEASKCHMVR